MIKVGLMTEECLLCGDQPHRQIYVRQRDEGEICPRCVMTDRVRKILLEKTALSVHCNRMTIDETEDYWIVLSHHREHRKIVADTVNEVVDQIDRETPYDDYLIDLIDDGIYRRTNRLDLTDLSSLDQIFEVPMNGQPVVTSTDRSFDEGRRITTSDLIDGPSSFLPTECPICHSDLGIRVREDDGVIFHQSCQSIIGELTNDGPF